MTFANNLRSATRFLQENNTTLVNEKDDEQNETTFDLTIIIVIIIVVVGLVASYFIYRYCKKKQDEIDKKNGKKKGKKKKKKPQEGSVADLESGGPKSWKKGENPEMEAKFASEMERQAEMEQVRSVASAIQMGMQMGLQNTQNVHSGVKSVLLKKNEQKQEERNTERIFSAQPDLSAAGTELEEEEAAIRKSKNEDLNQLEQQPGLELDDLDIMTSNLLASQVRKSKSGPLAAKAGRQKSKRGNFILAGWQVKSKDIEHVEDHETTNSNTDVYSKPASQFTYTFVKVGGINMACKKLDSANVHVSSIAEQQLAMRRMMVETRTLAELQHPNIVRLLGVCNEAGPASTEEEDDEDMAELNGTGSKSSGLTMCVLTEIAPRGDLRTLLDSAVESAHNTNNADSSSTSNSVLSNMSVSAELPLWLRMRMLKGVSLALRHAHAHLPNSILHRDLRPCNIVVAQDWTARVQEWGMASGASGEFNGQGYGGPSGMALGMLGIDSIPFRAGMAYQAPEVLTVSVGMEDEAEESESEDGLGLGSGLGGEAEAGPHTGEDDDEKSEVAQASVKAQNATSKKKTDADNRVDESGWGKKGDVYSFGVLAWEILGGNRPWHDRAEIDAAAVHAAENAEYLQEEDTRPEEAGMTAERLYNLVVTEKKRPHGYTAQAADASLSHNAPLKLAAATATRSTTHSMPLLLAEASEKKGDGSTLLKAIEGSEALALIAQCWHSDRRARPDMEVVSTALINAEKELTELGWGEGSTASAGGGDMTKELEVALGMVEGTIGGGRSSTTADVDVLLQKHRRLAQEAEAKAMQEEAEAGAGAGDDGADDDLTGSQAGFDLTASFANFYKGAFDGNEGDEGPASV